MAQLRNRGRVSSVPVQSNNMLGGIRFFLPSVNVNYITPDWDRTNNPTVVKIVPAIDTVKGKKRFLDYRYDEGQTGFEGWYAPLPCATYIGTTENKQSFVLYDPFDEDYDSSSNPYIFMYSTIKRLSKTKQTLKSSYRGQVRTEEFVALFPNTVNRDSVAFSPANKRLTFLNVIPLCHRDKIEYTDQGRLRGCNSGDTPMVMSITGGAAGSMLKTLCVEKEDGGNEFMDMYAYGDVTNLKTGSWAMIHHTGKFSPHNYTEAGAKAMMQGGNDFNTFEDVDASSVNASKKEGFDSFNVAFLDPVIMATGNSRKPLKYSVSKLISPNEAAILENYRPLSEYFFVPSHEEIAKYLAVAFKDSPYLLEIGLSDSGYFTDEVKGMLGNRTQIARRGAATPQEEYADPYSADEFVPEDEPKANGNKAVSFTSAERVAKAPVQDVYDTVETEESAFEDASIDEVIEAADDVPFDVEAGEELPSSDDTVESFDDIANELQNQMGLSSKPQPASKAATASAPRQASVRSGPTAAKTAVKPNSAPKPAGRRPPVDVVGSDDEDGIPYHQ